MAGQDTLRDDGLLLKKVLDENKYRFPTRLLDTYTDSFSVPAKLDLYEGYPHYHFAWPSTTLDGTRDEFNKNTAKGVIFVVS